MAAVYSLEKECICSFSQERQRNLVGQRYGRRSSICSSCSRDTILEVVSLAEYLETDRLCSGKTGSWGNVGEKYWRWYGFDSYIGMVCACFVSWWGTNWIDESVTMPREVFFIAKMELIGLKRSHEVAGSRRHSEGAGSLVFLIGMEIA